MTSRYIDGTTKRPIKRIKNWYLNIYAILSMKNPMRNDAKWCEIFLLKKGKKVCCPYRTDGEIHRRNDQKAHLMDQELLSHCLCHFAHEKPHAKRCKTMRNFFAWFRIIFHRFAWDFRTGFSKWPQSEPIGQGEWSRAVVGPHLPPGCNALSLLPLLARV